MEEIRPIRRWTPDEIRIENQRRGPIEVKASPRLLKAREKQKQKEQKENKRKAREEQKQMKRKEREAIGRERAAARQRSYDVLRDLRKLSNAADLVYEIFMDDPLPGLSDIAEKIDLNVFVVAGALELLIQKGRLFLHEMPSKVGYTITPIAEADMLVLPTGLRDKALEIMVQDKRSKRH